MSNRVELLLVRHGQSEYNLQHRIAGWTDTPLTDLGRRQAETLRDRMQALSPDGVWSSDLVRASETAELALSAPVRDTRVRELNFGDLEGAVWTTLADDIRRNMTAFASYHAPGGESVPQLRSRIHAFFDELEPGRHAVFCHGGVIRAVMHEFGETRFVSNGTIVRIDWTASSLIERIDGPEL